MSKAADIRFVQLGVLALRLNLIDREAVCAELAERRKQAPELLSRAALVLDLERIANAEQHGEALGELLKALGEMDYSVIGLRQGSGSQELAATLRLPILGATSDLRSDLGSMASSEPVPSAESRSTLHIDKPVRSGQQIYARDSDLVIAASVSAGAEVIADGSVHVYGSLRGRAVAGARGNEQARVYSLDFHAELVSVAGHYKVFEELPQTLRGGTVQAWLDGDQLHLAKLG